jgi:hypothetical protein
MYRRLKNFHSIRFQNTYEITNNNIYIVLYIHTYICICVYLKHVLGSKHAFTNISKTYVHFLASAPCRFIPRQVATILAYYSHTLAYCSHTPADSNSGILQPYSLDPRHSFMSHPHCAPFNQTWFTYHHFLAFTKSGGHPTICLYCTFVRL